MKSSMKIAVAFVALAALATFLTTSPPNQPPPCVYEDGSGGPLPCVWDAEHRGNGVGQSVRIEEDGTIRPITHEEAHQ